MVRGDDDQRNWARADRTIAPPQRGFARRMRKHPTEAERKLWWHMRHRLPIPGTHFRRQVQIGRYQVQIGRYIVDFVSHSAKLIVEIDGGQHGTRIEQDLARSRRLEADGYRVLRFWNNDVLSNIDGVLTQIRHAITATPTPDPSPQGGGEKD